MIIDLSRIFRTFVFFLACLSYAPVSGVGGMTKPGVPKLKRGASRRKNLPIRGNCYYRPSNCTTEVARMRRPVFKSMI